MNTKAAVFRVRVSQNLVVSIRRVSRSEALGHTIHDDRLAVSTSLAQNNLTNGCFDGDYFLQDFETARHFAALCLGYMKTLCETALDAIHEIRAEPDSEWVNPHLPGAGSRD